MTTWVYAPLLLSILSPMVARRMTTSSSPAVAVRAVVVVAAVTTIAYVGSMTMLSLTLMDDVPPLRAFDHRADLNLPKPVPGWLALSAALVLLVGSVRLVREVVARRRVVTGLRASGRPHDGLAIANMSEPFAVAVPGRPGHVLVTTGMLRALDGVDRRVLLAHENSHLTRRHHACVAAVAYAAAINPLLSRMTAAVIYLVERTADEDAAVEVGDRNAVARAVAKASLAASGNRFVHVLGLHGSKASDRLRAIAAPPSEGRWSAGMSAIAGVSAGHVICSILAVADFIVVARPWLTLVLG